MSSWWWWVKGQANDGDEGGDAAERSVDQKLETLVRETIQNSRDVVQDDVLEMTFRFQCLSGDHLVNFKEAIQYDDGLKPHLEACKKNRRSIQLGLDCMEQDEMYNLVIEDFNTEGLLGDEIAYGDTDPDPDRNWWKGLVKDRMVNKKSQNIVAGGSKGLGKAVIWAHSLVNSAIITSNAVEDVREHPALTSRSQIRANFPSHDCNGRFCGGIAHFGRKHTSHRHEGAPEEVAECLWDEKSEEFARRVSMDRGGRAGTSICIVGFREPIENDSPGNIQADDVNALADRIKEYILKHFWPLISIGGLKATIAIDRNGEVEEWEVKIEEGTEYEVFSNVLTSYREGKIEVDSVLSEGGSTLREVAISVPRRQTDPRHDQFDWDKVPVIIHALSHEEQNIVTDGNRAFLFRGPHMIVNQERRKVDPVVGLEYISIVPAGVATKCNSEEDEEICKKIDRFLLATEPTAHDEWTHIVTSLSENYARGAKKAIQDFMRAVKEAIQKAARGEFKPGKGAAPHLASLFQVGIGPGGDSSDAFLSMGSTKIHGGSFSTVVKRVVKKEGSEPLSDWEITLSVSYAQDRGGSVLLDGTKMSICLCEAIDESDIVKAGASATLKIPHDIKAVTVTGEYTHPHVGGEQLRPVLSAEGKKLDTKTTSSSGHDDSASDGKRSHVKRSLEFLPVAFYLSSFTTEDPERLNKTKPPKTIDKKLWADVWRYLFGFMGGGRTEKTFKNSLKNVVDKFDRVCCPYKEGWKDQPLEVEYQDVIDKYSGLTEEEMWNEIRKMIGITDA